MQRLYRIIVGVIRLKIELHYLPSLQKQEGETDEIY